MEMTPTGARTLELSRTSAADTPSVHRLSKDEHLKQQSQSYI